MKAKICGRCGSLYVERCTDCKPLPRRSTNQDGYDRKWQRFRKKLIERRAREGKLVCSMCGLAFGAASPHADHITPVTGQDDPLFFEPANIQFLHPDCHGKKTAADVRQGKTRR